MLDLRPRVLDEDSEAPELAEPTQPRRQSWQRRAVTLALGTGVTVLWSWICILVLDASTWPNSREALFQHAFEPKPLLPSMLLVWTVVLLFVALIGRLWVAIGVVTALTTLIAIVNMTKLDLRNDPLFPSDAVFLSQPGFLFDMVPTSKVVLGFAGLVMLVAGAWLAGRIAHRFFPRVTTGLNRRGLTGVRIARVLVVLLCLGLLHVATDFNEPGNPWRAAFDSQVKKWRIWDQRVNYRRNGFVAGLLFNMHVDAMARPQGYSKARVEAVVQKYVDQARAMNRGRTGSLADTNIVLVLSESFTDPSWLRTVQYPENPIPFTQDLMGRTVSGGLLTPGYGGGTANVEFELLTGQSLSQFKPQMSMAYEQLVDNYKHYPSAVSWFEERGHVPMAVHPFSPRMYSRPRVYPTFGFDKFITKDDMKNRSRGGGRYIDDASMFQETLDLMRENSSPLFLNVISMQNHMPYAGQYDDPITPTGLPPDFAEPAGQYARGLARTDQALADYLAALSKDPEPTAVVFYGDHLPGEIYPTGLVKREGVVNSHRTPWLIWTNKQKLQPRKLPTTSPTQLLPRLFDATDTPIPAYYALLDALDKQLPAMDAGLYIDAQDQVVRRSELTPEQRAVLADYRLIQYDLSIGKRYSEKTLFGDPPTGG